MSSATLIRVKRRRSQSPAEALVLHLEAKRARPAEQEASSEAAALASPKIDTANKKLFRFAATLTDANKAEDEKALYEAVGSKVSELKAVNETKKLRTPLKVKTKPVSSADDLRDKEAEARQSQRSESRFRVVGSRRQADVDINDLDEDKLFHLLDLVQEDEERCERVKPPPTAEPTSADDKISCNDLEMEVKKCSESDFVYDVFYHWHPERVSGQLDLDSPDSIRQIEKIDTETAEELYRMTAELFENYQEDRDFEAFNEDSDSNDENNWRNEYPDEDEEDEEGDDEYDEFGCRGRAARGRVAMADLDGDSDLDERFGNLGVKGDGELSSDDEDELVYSRTFERDADLHGTDYAKYKRKVLARDFYFEEKSSSSDSEAGEEDEHNDYY